MVCNVAFSTAAPTISPEVRQLWNSCRNMLYSVARYAAGLAWLVEAPTGQFEGGLQLASEPVTTVRGSSWAILAGSVALVKRILSSDPER